MANPESPTDVVTEAFADYLKSEIRGLTTLSDFPESNHRMKFPTIAVSCNPSGFVNERPYEYSRGAVSNNKSDILYVIGQYNWSIQLDLFHKTKEQVHDLHQTLIKVMNPNVPVKTGLVLTLSEYHDALCNYIITGYEAKFGEESSQRKEWRITVPALANHLSLLAKEEFIITQIPEIQLELPDEIID